ncbi:MAG: RNA polymerase sigma factor [Deltaproteobacteria bacterium]|nr:RNA polymerase sigma factor [Deltaproteobacteria bacterium]
MKRPTVQLCLVETDLPPDGEASVDFDALFMRYSPYAAAVAFRIMGSSDDVDDIVQDVFIEVHKGIHLLSSTHRIKGWVATITVRICAKRLRSRKFQRLLSPGWLSLTDMDEFDIPQDGLSPEEQVWLKNVYCVLDAMSVPLRVAWTLRYLQGERLATVAKICGCSLATAKRRVAKAHALIRRGVDDE